MLFQVNPFCLVVAAARASASDFASARASYDSLRVHVGASECPHTGRRTQWQCNRLGGGGGGGAGGEVQNNGGCFSGGHTCLLDPRRRSAASKLCCTAAAGATMERVELECQSGRGGL